MDYPFMNSVITLRERVEQCRRVAQHINDPAIRSAILGHMRAIDEGMASDPVAPRA
jgi:hypothetical protein